MRLFLRPLLLPAFAALICLPGCSGTKDTGKAGKKDDKKSSAKKDSQPAKSPAKDGKAAKAKKAKAGVPVKLAVASLADIEKRIATQHKGKVVVVDLWAMW